MLRFVDGFDHYTWTAGNPPAGDLLEKWTGMSGSGGGTVNLPAPVAARNGNGVQLSSSNVEMELFKTLDDQGTWIVGWAFRMGAVGDTGVYNLKFQDSSGGYQASVISNPSAGTFELYRGEGATALAISTGGLISPGTWMYLEAKLIIHNSTGLFELRRNGQVIATFSGDTQQHGSLTTARSIRFGGDRTQTGTTTIDDVYICDGVDSGVTGCPNNDYLGDVKVETLYPNGNGNSSQLLGSDGNSTNNYLLVDETTPNDATDYVGSLTPGQKDTYAMTNLSTVSGTIYGVQCVPNARKSDAGTRSFKTVTRSAGVEEDGPEVFLGTSFTMHPDIRESDPSGDQWTVSNVNAMEAGAKVFA